MREAGIVRVGVSGHIQVLPEAIPILEKVVRSVLLQEREKGGIKVLSALAKGADQLFANVALELGLPLVAVLTAPEARVLEDFKDEDSRSKFESYLQQAVAIERPYLQDVNAPSEYAVGDSYLCRVCDLIVALWDGKQTNHPAGTARVVDMRLGRGPAPYHSGDHCGPVVHVQTPRIGDTMDNVGKITLLG